MKTRIVLHSFDELSFVIVPTQNGTTQPGNGGGSNVPITPEGARLDSNPPILPWLTAGESARSEINSPLNG
jgi:hypothetical protein